jgi:2-C-methyl-D-erythritol 4-phosphate cytidylyltransferase
MQQHIIIVAGGSGARMMSDVPKQFLLLGGKPVLMHTISRFYNYNPAINIVLVLAENHIGIWKELCAEYSFNIEHTIALGGPTRFHSVKSGLSKIPNADGVVGVHDGARPLVSQQLIAHCYTTAAKYGNAIPAIAPAETVRQVDGPASKQLNRNNIRLVQTPQCFKIHQLKKAYESPFNEVFTDDASVAEDAGERIHLVEGEKFNLKITTPEDMDIAAVLIG